MHQTEVVAQFDAHHAPDLWLAPHHYPWEGHGLGFLGLRDTLIGKVTALAGLLTADDFLLAADGGIQRGIQPGVHLPFPAANQPKIARLGSDCAIAFAGANTQAYEILSLLSGQESPQGEEMIRWWWENGKPIAKSPEEVIVAVNARIGGELAKWEESLRMGQDAALPPPQVILGYRDTKHPCLVSWLADDYYSKDQLLLQRAASRGSMLSQAQERGELREEERGRGRAVSH